MYINVPLHEFFTYIVNHNEVQTILGKNRRIKKTVLYVKTLVTGLAFCLVKLLNKLGDAPCTLRVTTPTIPGLRSRPPPPHQPRYTLQQCIGKRRIIK